MLYSSLPQSFGRDALLLGLHAGRFEILDGVPKRARAFKFPGSLAAFAQDGLLGCRHGLHVAVSEETAPWAPGLRLIGSVRAAGRVVHVQGESV